MAVWKTPPPSALPAIDGLSMATTRCGVRYRARDDLVLFALPQDSTICGLFTRNAVKGEPVIWSQARPRNGAARGRGLLVVAGNANVQTGAKGKKACRSWAQAAAHGLGCSADEVWLSATGVIGMVPPTGRVERGVKSAAQNLKPRDWTRAAKAILTTDTVPKAVGRKVSVGSGKNNTVHIAAIAKGSGMIAPDMATMLCFAFTDAKLAPSVARQCLREAGAIFSQVDVDTYPSTSDMVTLAATGRRGAEIKSFTDPRLKHFRKALCEVFEQLALSLVADGEGAKRVIELKVTGAASTPQAERIVRALAAAPLVRTAFTGADPNWGRIVQTAGAVAPNLNPACLSVRIGSVLVSKNGAPYGGATNERRAKAIMRGKRYMLTLDLGKPRGATARRFVCDLTEGYIEINGSYRS